MSERETPTTKIHHLGKSFETIHYADYITDEVCEELKEKFFTKPNLYEVHSELYDIHKHKTNISKTHKYFFSDLMYDSKLYSSKWSIKEFFESNDLIRYAYAKMKAFPKVFPTTCSDEDNLNSVLRLSPSGTAAKLSNYPIDSVYKVLDSYNTNGNYYDYSCGWGVRLLGAMSKRLNYFGTDPNNLLVNQLVSVSDVYNKINKTSSIVDIRCQGSETFVPEWVDTMGLVFSSPPYYNLEDYKHGEQSILNKTYDEWLTIYWTETVDNIFKYITQDGFFLLNIKNFSKYALLDDMKQIAINKGFYFLHYIDLENINRPSLKHNEKDNNEKILVFSKNKDAKPRIYSLDGWD